MPWQRRQFSGRDLTRALNIADLREVARRRIPHFVFEYVEGGAEDENTLRCNRRAFEDLSFIPQTLVDTTARNHKIELFGRAAAAGFEALVFTTDANLFGSREWDRRSYRAPGKPTLRAMLNTLRHPRWMWDVLIREGMPRFRNFESFLPPGGATAVGGSTIIPKMFAPSITWDDIAWIRRHWQRKLIIKGVL